MLKMSTCHQCGQTFYSLKRNRPFCDPACRHAFNMAKAPANTDININPANLVGASLNDQGNSRAA